MRVVKGGIVLEGDSWVLNQLVASHIRSSRDQPISFQSSKNFSINVRNAAGELESQLTLGEYGHDSPAGDDRARATELSWRQFNTRL